MGMFGRDAKRDGWPVVTALVAATVIWLAWRPAFHAPYQYDDYNTPVRDAASQSLGNWWQLLPRTLRPLTKLTYAFESSVGASEAPARRVLNGLLFGGCAVLLGALLRRAGVPRPFALLLVCVWAIHPVHAETVVALAGRPVLLSLFLMLASALLVLRERPRAALLGAVLALLARESALPWLVACAALLAHARGVSARRIVVTSVVAAGVGAAVLVSSSGLRTLVVSAFSAAGAWNHLGLQWAALSQGTSMLFVNPAAFTPDIEFAPSGGARLTLILATLACYVAAVWLVLNKTLSRELRLFALLWLCLVVPTHSIVPKLDALTARPFSASLAPLLGLVACGVVHWLSRVPKWWPVASLALVGALAVLFPVTLRRARLYQDPIALWTDAAARTTRSVRPLINLGTLLAQRGQLHEAQSALTQALQRDPTRYDTRFRLLSVRRAMLHAPSPTGN
jgi:hypothetical protein